MIEVTTDEQWEAAKYLVDTDYISNQLTEAIAVYLMTGDKTLLETKYAKYREIIAQREDCRMLLNGSK